MFPPTTPGGGKARRDVAGLNFQNGSNVVPCNQVSNRRDHVWFDCLHGAYVMAAPTSPPRIVPHDGTAAGPPHVAR